MKNIILIGFMGTGKSAVAAKLCRQLSLQFIDTDAVIEADEGCSIKEIFRISGEDHFRKLETQLLKKLSESSDAVISCGGGIVLREENRILLRSIGTVFLLTADYETILKRLKNDTSRPLLSCEGKSEKVRQLIEERRSLYEETADHIVHTDGLTIDEVCRMILSYRYAEEVT